MNSMYFSIGGSSHSIACLRVAAHVGRGFSGTQLYEQVCAQQHATGGLWEDPEVLHSTFTALVPLLCNIMNSSCLTSIMHSTVQYE